MRTHKNSQYSSLANEDNLKESTNKKQSPQWTPKSELYQLSHLNELEPKDDSSKVRFRTQFSTEEGEDQNDDDNYDDQWIQPKQEESKTAQTKKPNSFIHIQNDFMNFIEKKKQEKERSKPDGNRMASGLNNVSPQQSTTSIQDGFNNVYSSKLLLPMGSLGNLSKIKDREKKFFGKKGSIEMSDVFQYGLVDVCEGRRKDMESKRLLKHKASIMSDKSLTDDQKRVRVNNLDYNVLADRVKNAIEKTRKVKENQFKTADKNKKFENQLKIFKNLDTFIETKSYLSQLNTVEESAQAKLSKASVKLKAITAFKTNRQSSLDLACPTDVKQLLLKSKGYIHQLKGRIDNTKYQRENEEEIEERDQHAKENQKSEKISLWQSRFGFQQQSNNFQDESDADSFYNNLDKQFQSGYFTKAQKNKKSDNTNDVWKQQNTYTEQIDELADSIIEEDKQEVNSNHEHMLDYRQKAKKITQMLLKTSQSILKKNIDETNNAIKRARQIRTYNKVQEQLNIKSLYARIQHIPKKMQKWHSAQPSLSTEPTEVEEEEMRKSELENEAKEREMLLTNSPAFKKSASHRHDLDFKLQRLSISIKKHAQELSQRNIQNSQESTPKSSKSKQLKSIDMTGQVSASSQFYKDYQNQQYGQDNMTNQFKSKTEESMFQGGQGLSKKKEYIGKLQQMNQSIKIENQKVLQLSHYQQRMLNTQQQFQNKSGSQLFKKDLLLKQKRNQLNTKNNINNNPSNSARAHFNSLGNTNDANFNLKSSFITDLVEENTDSCFNNANQRKTLPNLIQEVNKKIVRNSSFQSSKLKDQMNHKQLDSILLSLSGLQSSLLDEKKEFKQSLKKIETELDKQSRLFSEQPLESLRLCFVPFSPHQQSNNLHNLKVTRIIN